jgi:hypothetical protein
LKFSGFLLRPRKKGQKNCYSRIHEILQILSVSLFEKTPIFEALSLRKPGSDDTQSPN